MNTSVNSGKCAGKFIKNNVNDIVSIAVFTIIIFFLGLCSFLKEDISFSENENRVLAQRPSMNLKTVFDGSFESDYEEYVSDQFAMRDLWIRLKTVSEMALQKKEVNGVYICRDNYLIEAHESVDTQEAYQNAEYMLEFINSTTGTLGKNHVYMMLVPTASAVLTDYLPAYADEFDQNALIDYIKSNAQDAFIDVRNELEAHKDEYIYYRTDHHWTSYGAYLAYVKWAKECGLDAYSEEDFDIETASESFLGSTFSKVNYAAQKDTLQIYNLKKTNRFGVSGYNVNINNGQLTTDTLYIRDYLDKKDKYSTFLGGNNPVVTIETLHESIEEGKADEEETEDSVLLVIKDSYAHSFVPFAVNHYDKTIMVDLRYLKQPIGQVIEENNVTDILVLYNAAGFAQDVYVQNVSFYK